MSFSNEWINCGAFRQWNIIQCSKEMSYQERYEGPLNVYYQVKGRESVRCSVVSDCLQACGLLPSRLLCPWDSPGRNAGVHCHSLLQGIFPTQGLNPGLLTFRRFLYPLKHQGSPNVGELKLKKKGLVW